MLSRPVWSLAISELCKVHNEKEFPQFSHERLDPPHFKKFLPNRMPLEKDASDDPMIVP
jgi:hypothetical protein